MCAQIKSSMSISYLFRNGSSAARMVEVRMAWYIIMSPVSLESGGHGMKFRWSSVQIGAEESSTNQQKHGKYHVMLRRCDVEVPKICI